MHTMKVNILGVKVILELCKIGVKAGLAISDEPPYQANYRDFVSYFNAQGTSPRFVYSKKTLQLHCQSLETSSVLGHTVCG